jgi:hypothetical protein
MQLLRALRQPNLALRALCRQAAKNKVNAAFTEYFVAVEINNWV